MKETPPWRTDPSPGKDLARRRRERIAIGIVAVLVIGLTILEANLAAVGGMAFSSNIIIFALINLNVILIVLLIFLVTRNVFKLILDRKRNILGAKIRSRLVFIFIAFSLIPTILLFVAAANITTTSIKSWIGGRVGVALTNALDIARGDLEKEAARLSGVADQAASAVLRKRRKISLKASLEKARRGSSPDVSLLVVGRAGVLAASGGVTGEIASQIRSRLKGEEGNVVRGGVMTFIGESYASAVRRLPDGRAVVAVKTIPRHEAKKIREIAKAYDEYHQVRLLDDPIRASYIATLILITLLVVFAASWMGIYLARQITVPIQMLAEGTEKVASGDLDVRLDYRSDDEFGHLVGSFNRMTADLKGMKKSLEDANVSLSSTFEELRRRSRFIETILTNISTGV
ncbi:MAG: HAMP domain-containing protein, partial [Deltaproteobacteria bacterium]|nr:HAMP domain-containing protein [Deltaproteobacteria bacterium]